MTLRDCPANHMWSISLMDFIINQNNLLKNTSCACKTAPKGTISPLYSFPMVARYLFQVLIKTYCLFVLEGSGNRYFREVQPSLYQTNPLHSLIEAVLLFCVQKWLRACRPVPLSILVALCSGKERFLLIPSSRSQMKMRCLYLYQ